MKFGAIIINSLTLSIRRFPTVVFCTLLALAVGLHLMYTYFETANDYSARYQDQLKLILSLCNFSGVMGIAIDIFSEKNIHRPLYKTFLRILNLVIGIALFFILDPFMYTTDIVKLCVLCVSAHFIVSAAPFIFDRNQASFWGFNKALFLNAITGIFYSIVLYLGLALAVLAQSELLKLYTDSDIYAYLALFVGIGFNTIYFLSTFPAVTQPTKATITETTYPLGLKIFAGYILVPLVGIYLTILLLFELRIVLTGETPEGFISWMIFCFAVAGILSFLLLYPVLGHKENRWLRIALRIYSFSLIPLLVLLWWAIYTRIEEHGITELRYIHAALSLWLSVFVLSFILKNNKVSIRWLPISLAVSGILISFGPWGYSASGLRSQKHKISAYLQEKDTVSGAHIKGKLAYLTNYHGVESVYEYITPEGKEEVMTLLKESDTSSFYSPKYIIENTVLDNLNFDLPTAYNIYGSTQPYESYNIDHEMVIDMPASYSRFIKVKDYPGEYEFKEQHMHYKLANNYDQITITLNGQSESFDIRQYINDNADELIKLSSDGYGKAQHDQTPSILKIGLLKGKVQLIISNMIIYKNFDADGAFTDYSITSPSFYILF